MLAIASGTALASITYELNGGVTNDYGWLNKNDMFQACMADCGVTGLSTLDELQVAGDASFGTICNKLTDVSGMLSNTKWDWLEAYIMSVQNADADATALVEGTTSAGWRYAIAAFFLESQRTGWPKSANFSAAGKVEAFIPAWKHAFANPTEPTEEFVLNAPYKEGDSFLGWYWNADFSGGKVTTINAESNGTLYAKFGEYIPTIAEVKAMASNTETQVSGVVTFIQNRYAFIQDATGGLMLFMSATPTFAVGEQVVVSGLISAYGGAPQLKMGTEVSAEPGTMPEPIVFENMTPLVQDTELKYFGLLVSVPGLTIESYANTGYPTVSDGINSVECSNMVLDQTAFPIGTKITITAVASWYNGFQFRGDVSGIEIAKTGKKESYTYPTRDNKYNLTNNWVVSVIEDNYAENRPGSTGYVRGMAAKDGIMYFINRETASITRVDGTTGNMLEPIKITGEHLFEVEQEDGTFASGVTLPFNDIKFDNAGNCLIGGCITGPTQYFMVYKVDLSTGATTLIVNDRLADNPAYADITCRFDAFGVAGDVTKNGVIMAADASGSWNVYRWLITDGVAGEGEQIAILLDPAADQSLCINAAGFGTAPQIAPQDELGSLFYVDGFNTLPMLFYGTPEIGATLVDDFIYVPSGTTVQNNEGETTTLHTGLNGLQEFQVGDEYFLVMVAGYTVSNPPSTFALYKFADEARTFDGLEPLWYFPHNGLGSAVNGCRTAVPSVEVNGNTATISIYAVDNGYASYTLTIGDLPTPNTITYELNGGITNDYGWMSKSDMFEACMTDALGYPLDKPLNEFKQSNTPFDDLFAYFNEDSHCQNILDNARWDWLEEYLMMVQEKDQLAATLTAGVASQDWRYAIAAFFFESQYDTSLDYTDAGKDEAYIPYWKHGYDNPTQTTREFTLNAPYKENHIFEGWYATPDFSSAVVTTINASTSGTLYAKWKEDNTAGGSSCEDAISIVPEHTGKINSASEVWYRTSMYNLPLHFHFCPDDSNSSWGPEILLDLTCTPDVYDDPKINSLLTNTQDFNFTLPIEFICDQVVRDGKVEWDLTIADRYREAFTEAGVTYDIPVYLKVTYYESGTITMQSDTTFKSCMDKSQYILLSDTIDILANDPERTFVVPYCDWQKDSVQFVWTGEQSAQIFLAMDDCDFTPNASNANVWKTFDVSSVTPYKIDNSQIRTAISDYGNGGLFYGKILSNTSGELVVEKIIGNIYTSESVTICHGETYTWNGQTYANTGTYTVTIPNPNGSDTIATLNLTILPEAITKTETVTVSSDELPYKWHEQDCTTTGRYTNIEKYTTADCDSIIHILDLTVLTTGAVDEKTITICDSEAPYQWYGKSYNQTGKYTFTEKYVGTDIDSIQHILNLTVNPTVYVEETIIACDSYDWNGQTYTQSGDYTYTTVAANGCDSIVTLHLTINQSEAAPVERATICYGETYTWNGQTYSTEGEYSITFSNTNGCDSIATLHLTVLPEVQASEESVTICYGEQYEWNGKTYTTTGEYSMTLSDVNGCDSIPVLYLTVMPQPMTKIQSVTISNDQIPYVWNDNEYTETGQYTVPEKYTNIDCDSVLHVLDLTVLTTDNYDEENVTICDSELPFQWRGQSYTQSGKYSYAEKYVGTTIDSIQHILNLSVVPTHNINEYISICHGETYSWNNQIYSTGGEYSITLSNIYGCDSVVTLYLTVLPPAITIYTDTMIAHADLPYIWRGQYCDTSGEYTATIPFAANTACDSVIYVLNLTVESVNKCGADLSWEYDNGILTISGSGAMYDNPDLQSYRNESWYPYRVRQVILSDQLTHIGNVAFADCANLTNIVIPSSVTSIGDGAFSWTGLQSVTIPASVTDLGEQVFETCNNLHTILYEGTPSSISNQTVHPFIGCVHLDTIITPAALWHCTTADPLLEARYGVPHKARYIEVTDGELTKQAMKYIAKNSGTVEVLDLSAATNTTLPLGALLNNYRLSTLYLPEQIEVIPEMLAEGCHSLAEILIPATVTEIGNYAFAGCTNVWRMTVEAVLPPKVYDKTFDGIDRSISLIVPAGSEELYRQAEYWKEFFIDDTHSQSPKSNCQKILHEDHILILREGKVYTTMGQLVK